MITKQQIIDRMNEINLLFPDPDPNDIDHDKNRENYRKRLGNLNNIKDKVLREKDIKIKQYMLYVMCNRARLWHIKREDLIDMYIEVAEQPPSPYGGEVLSVSQLESALKGYSDNRKISNKRIYEKTGLMNFGNDDHEVFTLNSANTLINKLTKEKIKEDIIKCLRRYIAVNKKRKSEGKKEYTIEKIVELLKKNGFKISRSSLYRDKDYRIFFMSGIEFRKHRGKKGYSVSEY